MFTLAYDSTLGSTVGMESKMLSKQTGFLRVIQLFFLFCNHCQSYMILLVVLHGITYLSQLKNVAPLVPKEEFNFFMS